VISGLWQKFNQLKSAIIDILINAIAGAFSSLGLGSLSFQQQSNFTAPSQVSAPALGASNSTINNNTFNIGGNNISSNMDAAVFEARVLRVIRQNL